MKGLARCLISVSVLVVAAGCAGPARGPGLAAPAEPAYWPTEGWRITSPEAQGMDSQLLADMFEHIQRQHLNLRSVFIVRHGYLVVEAYFDPFSRQTRQPIASVTKSVVGTLIGVAVDQGVFNGADQTLLDLFPAGLADAGSGKQAITLRHLLTMTSGLDCSDQPRADRPVMEQSPDWVAYTLELPVASTPGSQFNYCSSPVHLLSALIQQESGTSTRDFANRNLFAPLGIPEVPAAEWGTDPQGIVLGGYGLSLTPGEMARLGFLYLHQGRWAGRQIVPADWVIDSTRQHATKEDGTGYGYLWTVYPAEGRYAALGRGGQHIHVMPELDMVVVFNGALPASGESPELNQLLKTYILPAIKSDSTLAENPHGAARLEAALQAAASPARPVRALPEAAQALSGHTYFFDDNPLQWQMLWLSFDAGQDLASVTLNGTQRFEIGLDNRYRVTSTGQGTVALRGTWEDEHTFVVDQITYGDIAQYQTRWTYSGDGLDIVYSDGVSGTTLAELHGRR
jgi:CubicO group peptidase (beta-lactamase class C family)